MAPRNKGKKAAAAKAAKEAEESAQKAAAASSSASKSQKGIDKGVTLQVPTSSESITGTPAPTPTASVPKTSTSGFGRDSATGSTIELQEPQDEVPEEGYGSEDSADSAEIAAMFGSGGAPRADSFSEGDDGATLASPKDETPEPFEDTTPSYNSIQEIEFEPPISRKPKLKSLFVPLPSPPIPGQEDTSDVQIYDPETDGTVDGSVVRPRTPPLKRLATIAAAQKANAKARKEAGSNKPSLFVPAGKTDDDGNLGYLQAPLMVDGSDQMLAVDSAEEIAKLNAQAAVTQYVEVRNESLVADLGESISKELEQWRSYAKKAPKSEEAVKIANAAIEALQKSQLRLIGENLNLKLVTDVLQEETKKLTQTVNGALFQQAGVETEFAREHKMIQARNLKVIARLEEKIARLQNTEAHVLLKESESKNQSLLEINTGYAAHLKEIAEDYKRLQEQFLELKTQQDYVKASVQPQLKDNEELWVPEMEEEFAKLRSEKEKDELIIRQGTEISVLQKQQKEAEKKISAYAKSGNKPVGVRHRNEGSALGSPQSAVQTRSAAEGDSLKYATRHGRPSELAVSVAILRAEQGLKYMQGSRASRGIKQGDIRNARAAACEAYTMSLDLADERLQSRCLFWLGVIEFYDSNPWAARNAILEAQSCNEWVLNEEEEAWLEKWLDATEKGNKPSQSSSDYEIPSEAAIPPSSEGEDEWEKVTKSDVPGQLKAQRGIRVDDISAKSAEERRSRWDVMSYYI